MACSGGGSSLSGACGEAGTKSTPNMGDQRDSFKTSEAGQILVSQADALFEKNGKPGVCSKSDI